MTEFDLQVQMRLQIATNMAPEAPMLAVLNTYCSRVMIDFSFRFWYC